MMLVLLRTAMTEHNLPEPDDAPWLNLSQDEINQLRYDKQKLTDYGKQRLMLFVKSWRYYD